jgi:hypothetical protein
VTISLPFKLDLAPLVEGGEKLRTIRRRTKREIKPGDLIRCFSWLGTPYRSKQREIGRFEITRVLDIVIGRDSVLLSEDSATGTFWRVIAVESWDLDKFARLDGIQSYSEMKDFFRTTYGRLPFRGVLIEWKRRA